MSNARRFVSNSLALTVASLSVVILGAIYRVFIARSFGDQEFGKYVFITTYITYFSAISILGLRHVIIREVAKAPNQHRLILLESLKIRALSTTVAFLLACIIVLFLGKSSDIQIGVAVIGVSLFTAVALDTAESMLISIGAAHYITISSLVSNTIKIVVGIYMLHQGCGLIAILLLFVAISFFNAVLGWLFYKRAFTNIKTFSGIETQISRRFLINESLPFFYNTLVSKVYYKNDILILSLLKGDRVVGWYGAAYLPIDALLVIVSSIVAAAYPLMSRYFGSNRKLLSEFHNRLSRYLMLLFLPIAIVLTAIGPEVMHIIFGDDYAVSAPVLRFLGWMPPAEAVTIGMGTLLGAAYEQRLVVKLSVLNALINILLCFALISKYSYIGGAIGTVVSGYITLFIVMYAVNKKIHRVDWWQIAGKPLLCAIFACGIFYCIKHTLGSWLGLLFSFISYVLVVWLVKAFSSEDLQLVRNVLSHKSSAQEST